MPGTLQFLKTTAQLAALGILLTFFWVACSGKSETVKCQERALQMIVRQFGKDYPQQYMVNATEKCVKNPQAF